MTSTIWKYVKGYEGLYEVSNTGLVRSCDRIVPTKTGSRHYSEKILEPEITENGYFRITISYKNKHKRFLLHRVVAEHFISNPYNKPEVNHKDGNKANNNIDNLEWVTCSENIKHGYDTGLLNIESVKIHNSIPIVMYDKVTNKIIQEFSSMIDCFKQTGYKINTISYHCSNNTYPRTLDVYFRYKQ